MLFAEPEWHAPLGVGCVPCREFRRPVVAEPAPVLITGTVRREFNGGSDLACSTPRHDRRATTRSPSPGTLTAARQAERKNVLLRHDALARYRPDGAHRTASASRHHEGMPAYDRDPHNEVVVRWTHDDGDGVGSLEVSASANGFAGTSAAWFERVTVLAFADALTRYPLPDGDGLRLSSGFLEDEERPAQEHVGIAVEPVGVKGQVGCRAHLATAAWPDSRIQAQHDVRLELLTTYQRLAEFSSDLAAVIAGSWPEAVLGGEGLA